MGMSTGLGLRSLTTTTTTTTRGSPEYSMFCEAYEKADNKTRAFNNYNCQSSYNMNMMEHMRWWVTSKYLFHEGLAQISPHSIFSRNLHLLYWVVVGRGITNTIVVFTSCLQKFKINKTSPGVLGPDQLWIRQNTEICKSSKKTFRSAKYWKQERQTTTS